MVALLLTVGWLTPAGAKDLSQQNGQELYERLCSGCHGAHGEGDGTIAAYFKMRPPDLTQLAKRNAGQFPADEVRRTVDGRESPGPHGSRQMPVWGVALYYTDTKNPRQEQEVGQIVERVVEYLRTIQKQ
jgi:mono/diheme cytochrome c family protein